MLILCHRNQEHLKIGTNADSLTGERPSHWPVDGKLVFAEKLFPVFDEADQHHDDRPNHPQKKERFKQPNCDRGQDHE